MSRLRRLLMTVALACVVASAQCALGSPITIDDFDSGQVNSLASALAPTVTSTETGLAGVIGGQRDAETVYLAGLDGVATAINYRSWTGAVAFSEDAATSGALTLTYGGGADLNANLTADGNRRFDFTFDQADLQGTLNVTVTTTGRGSSTGQVNTPSGIYMQNVEVYLDFSQFTASTGLGADFTDIDRISVAINGANSGDYRITAFRTTPEPVTLALLLLGAPLVFRRLRS